MLLHGMIAHTYIFRSWFKVNSNLKDMFILKIEPEVGFIIPTSSNISPHAQERAFEE